MIDMPEDDSKVVNRDTQDVEDPRGALVKRLQSDIKDAKKHWEKAYQWMREDMDFARGKQHGADDDNDYVANMVQRHIQQRTAVLYAKNPKAVAKCKPRMDLISSEDATEFMQQMQQSAMMGMPPDPAMAMQAEQVMAVQQQRKVLDGLSRTLELLYQYYVDEQVVPFKKSMKQLVRRAITVGVAYVKIGFQRAMGPSPETQRQIADFSAQLAHMERMAADLADGETEPDDQEAERLKLMIESLQAKEEVIVREGLVFDFPLSTAIIPDKKLRSLDGFVGCQWVAQEFDMTPDDVQATWGIDVGSQYTAYNDRDQAARLPDSDKLSGNARVWEMYHKQDGQVYWLCDGYPDFLEPPAPPPITLERFWPWFSLMFNELEHETMPYPLSDVALMRPMQIEHNRARGGLIEHRKAALPWYAAADGALDDEDQDAISGHRAHDVVLLRALQSGQKVQDVLQAMTGSGVDPNLYSTAEMFDDILRVVGVQEANLGGTSSATATESSIAESSRLSSLESASDDMDEFLTELARNGGQILLKEVSPETAKEKVGEGAVWPSMSESQIADEVYLEIKAGSSGRPNREQDLMNFERVAPLLIQIPGIKVDFLAREALKRMDDKLDLSEAFEMGLPSITAMNGMTKTAADPMTDDPNAQGAQGGDNAPKPTGQDTSNPNPVGRPPMEPANTREQIAQAGMV